MIVRRPEMRAGNWHSGEVMNLQRRILKRRVKVVVPLVPDQNLA